MASQTGAAAAPAITDPPAAATSDPSGQTTAPQSGSKVQEVTKQVRSIVHGAADSASTIVNKVTDKFEKAVDKATEKISLKASDIQQNLTRSLNFPVSSGASNSNPDQPAPEASSDGAPAFPMSIITWCSSLCGGSKNANARGLDPSSLQSTELFQNVAGQFSAAITDASTKLEAEVQEVKKSTAAQIDATAKQTKEQLDAVAKQTAAPASS